MRTDRECPWLTIPDVARLTGVRRDSAWRWVKTGLLAPDGSRVRLRVERVGGRWKTRRRWLWEWRNSLNGKTPEAPAVRGSRAAALEDQRVLAERLAR